MNTIKGLIYKELTHNGIYINEETLDNDDKLADTSENCNETENEDNTNNTSREDINCYCLQNNLTILK